MALRKRPTIERDLASRLEVNLDVDVYKGDYHIRPVPEPEIFRTSTSFLPNINSRFLVAVNAMALVLWSLYFWYEVGVVRYTQEIAGYTLWRLWTSVVGEMGVLIPDLFVSFEVIFPFFFRNETQTRRYRLLGNAAPSVDIAISCCGEDPDVVMDTIIAAASQDYPAYRFRIFILDDKKDAFLEHLIRDFQSKKERPLITYLARPKSQGIRHYYKGGNLRYGYEVSNDLDQGSEYFAALDADMITEPDWLRRVVPHLILHDNLALACPPQVFEFPIQQISGNIDTDSISTIFRMAIRSRKTLISLRIVGTSARQSGRSFLHWIWLHLEEVCDQKYWRPAACGRRRRHPLIVSSEWCRMGC